MNPTPNEQDAMKDIERLIDDFEDACIEDGENREAYRAEELKPPRLRDSSRSALLAAIRKLVAQSQDAQPVAAWMSADRMKCIPAAELDAYMETDAPKGIAQYVAEKYTIPLFGAPIPQAGKVLEALTKAHHALMTGLAISPAINATNAAIALLRSLPQEEAAAQMQQWMPIETAPKDGTWVQLFGKHPRDGCAQMSARWVGEWESGDDCQRPYLNPTHWMPLPPEPLRRSEQSTDKEQG